MLKDIILTTIISKCIQYLYLLKQNR